MRRLISYSSDNTILKIGWRRGHVRIASSSCRFRTASDVLVFEALIGGRLIGLLDACSVAVLLSSWALFMSVTSLWLLSRAIFYRLSSRFRGMRSLLLLHLRWVFYVMNIFSESICNFVLIFFWIVTVCLITQSFDRPIIFIVKSGTLSCILLLLL